MCGRFVIHSAPDVFRRHFAYAEIAAFPPRYNIAPTQPIPIVRLENGERRLALVRWGLIPSWVKDPRGFAQIHNARGEGVLDKPSFRNAIRRRRCLVPADGFYEWKEEGGGRKTPYYVRMKSGAPMALAGLWETWIGPNGEEVDTATIITTEAVGALAHVHHRVPVIVPPEAFAFWLDCAKVAAETAAALIAPAPDGMLEAFPVSPAVNRATSDYADLIAPVPARQSQPVTPEPQAVAPKKRKPPSRPDDGQPSLF